MLSANMPLIINAVIFICYFIFFSNRRAWPEHIIYWTWISFIIHVFCHHFAYGLQNTTRNIARVHLIKRDGIEYDQKLIVPIQTALVPDSMLPITILWQTAHIGSFALLLFFQGWATALVAEFIVLFIVGFFPINYQSHLKRVQKHTQNIKFNETFGLLMMGVMIDELIQVTEQAIEEKRNPQQWWATEIRDATLKMEQ
jgi:hypothetical protein